MLAVMLQRTAREIVLPGLTLQPAGQRLKNLTPAAPAQKSATPKC